ncbi:hypothetical protein MMALV_04830 [Candidatus Methanomethylophilus alvi Mx1201]|uniref:Uncharacterized protein n=1 Tax=Methanomethylophilus alvi (strain Mx1201) TaxID=1236689 RepID=M9SCN7_METAX|nr:hypothetical protein MMALV_04830 [Candidatus Methanomethylophilus alvi Mx1201]
MGCLTSDKRHLGDFVWFLAAQLRIGVVFHSVEQHEQSVLHRIPLFQNAGESVFCDGWKYYPSDR